MDDQRRVKGRPQPDAHVIVLATLPSHEAPLLIGRLEEAGIRAMATPSGSSPGQWTALPSVPGLAAAAVRPGLVDVLVDARELETARRIAAEWDVGEVSDPGDSPSTGKSAESKVGRAWA